MTFFFINDIGFTTLDQSLFKILSVNPQGLIRNEILDRLNKYLDPTHAYPRTTVYDHLKQWLEKELIETVTQPCGGKGRPYVLFSLSNLGMKFYQKTHEEGYW